MTQPLSYLATPYSRYPSGITAAFEDASRLAARLLAAGVNCYSPIAHAHPLAIYGNLDPLDLKMWLGFDEAMMSRCDVLIVAHMDGWASSSGITHEVDFFDKVGKPVFDLEPNSLKMVRRRSEWGGEWIFAKGAQQIFAEPL